MKRTLISAGLVLAALGLTCCQKVQQEIPSNEPSGADLKFSIVANYEAPKSPEAAPVSKTVNSGLDTKWAAEDALCIFHSASGAASYINDGKFTVSDVETGKFNGTLAEALNEDLTYDWYALYPYSAAVATPSSSDGYIAVASAEQTQNGNGSTAHLAGATLPLYGVIKEASADVTPSFTLNQLTSVVKISVKNASNAPFSVSSVTFTAPEAVAGEFAVDFTGESVVFTPNASAVSSAVSLNVTGGEEIAVNGSADFYIAVKPFIAASGSKIKVAVNGNEKEITLTKDFTFASGRIKPIPFDYTFPVPVAYGVDLGEGYGGGSEGTHANLRVPINNTHLTKGYAYSSKYNFTAMSEVTVECLVKFNHHIPWADNSTSNWLNQLLGTPDYFGIRLNHANGDASTAPTTGKFNCQVGGTVELNSVQVNLDEWHHVALTFKDGTATVYVDGVAGESNSSCIATINLTQANNGEGKYHDFLIGQYGQSRWLNGCLSEVRLWSVARTAEQIAANKYSVDPQSTGLLAYWKMCGTTWDEILKDYSGNGFDIEQLNNSAIVAANVPVIF